MSDLNPINFHLVSSNGNKTVIMNQPIRPLSRDEVLMFAAWLVTMAPGGPITDSEFAAAREAVEST